MNINKTKQNKTSRHYYAKCRRVSIVRGIALVVLLTFTFFEIFPPSFLSSKAYAQTLLDLPIPGTMVTTTLPFNPPILRGLIIHPENPLRFDFIVDRGDGGTNNAETHSRASLQDEYTKLIKYFLATLTIPEDDLWVNLSPYEKERIIPNEFGQTEMGRDLLAQDYILKQLMASLTYPESGLGKKFWDEVYKKAYEQYGTTNIPLNTFNKVWIVPDKAVVYENKDKAFVVESHLKAMLEEDYLALSKNMKNEKLGTAKQREEDVKAISNVSSLIAKEILIPAIEKEVNENKNFAQLRQIYASMILAAWYKKALKDNVLNKVYSNQKKINGVDIDDPKIKEKIYQQYIDAFKKGVYSMIKEDHDQYTGKMIPRRYFSGGFEATDMAALVEVTHEMPPSEIELYEGRLEEVHGSYLPPDMAEKQIVPVTLGYYLAQKLGKEEIRVVGGTLEEAIDNIRRSIQAHDQSLVERMFDEQGRIQRWFNIYLNDEDIRFLEAPFSKVILGSKDTLAIIPAIAGGSDVEEPNDHAALSNEGNNPIDESSQRNRAITRWKITFLVAVEVLGMAGGLWGIGNHLPPYVFSSHDEMLAGWPPPSGWTSLKLRDVPNATKASLKKLTEIFHQIQVNNEDLSGRIFDLFFQNPPPQVLALLQEMDSQGFVEQFDHLFGTNYSKGFQPPSDYVESLLKATKQNGATDHQLAVLEKAFEHLKRHPFLYALVSGNIAILKPDKSEKFLINMKASIDSGRGVVEFNPTSLSKKQETLEDDIRRVAGSLAHEAMHNALQKHFAVEFSGGIFGETIADFTGALARVDPGTKVSPQPSIDLERWDITHWHPYTYGHTGDLFEQLNMPYEQRKLILDLFAQYRSPQRWEPLFMHSIMDDLLLTLNLASWEIQLRTAAYTGQLTSRNEFLLDWLKNASRSEPKAERATLLHIYHNFELYWTYADLRKGIMQAAYFESGENQDIAKPLRSKIEAKQKGVGDVTDRGLRSLRDYESDLLSDKLAIDEKGKILRDLSSGYAVEGKIENFIFLKQLLPTINTLFKKTVAQLKNKALSPSSSTMGNFTDILINPDIASPAMMEDLTNEILFLINSDEIDFWSKEKMAAKILSLDTPWSRDMIQKINALMDRSLREFVEKIKKQPAKYPGAERFYGRIKILTNINNKETLEGLIPAWEHVITSDAPNHFAKHEAMDALRQLNTPESLSALRRAVLSLEQTLARMVSDIQRDTQYSYTESYEKDIHLMEIIQTLQYIREGELSDIEKTILNLGEIPATSSRNVSHYARREAIETLIKWGMPLARTTAERSIADLVRSLKSQIAQMSRWEKGQEGYYETFELLEILLSDEIREHYVGFLRDFIPQLEHIISQDGYLFTRIHAMEALISLDSEGSRASLRRLTPVLKNIISDPSSDSYLVGKVQKVLEYLQSLPSPQKKDALLINMGIGKAVVVADGGQSFSLELKEQLGEKKLIVSQLGEQAGQDAVDNAFLGEISTEQDVVTSRPGSNTPGGIDLTQKRLPLETTGEGVDFNLPFDPNHLDQIPINGLTPVIFQITPVTDLPLLLGLAENQSKELSAVR